MATTGYISLNATMPKAKYNALLYGRPLYIYRLKSTDPSVYYDTVDEFIIMARDSKQARKLAAGNPGEEGPETWLSSRKSKILKIGRAQTQYSLGQVVCRSFNAG